MTRHRFDQGTHEASVEARIERRRAPRGSAHEARPDAPPGRGVDRGETRGNRARGRTRRRKATPAPVPARGAKVPESWLFRANGQTVIRHACLPQSLCVLCAAYNATRVRHNCIATHPWARRARQTHERASSPSSVRGTRAEARSTESGRVERAVASPRERRAIRTRVPSRTVRKGVCLALLFNKSGDR